MGVDLRLHGLPLLLIRWQKILLAAQTLITASILEVTSVNTGNRSSLTESVRSRPNGMDFLRLTFQHSRRRQNQSRCPKVGLLAVKTMPQFLITYDGKIFLLCHALSSLSWLDLCWVVVPCPENIGSGFITGCVGSLRRHNEACSRSMER